MMSKAELVRKANISPTIRFFGLVFLRDLSIAGFL